MPTAVFQLRDDDQLLREVKELEKEREWRAGFEAMGRAPDVSNVEYALAAQREVLLGEWLQVWQETNSSKLE